MSGAITEENRALRILLVTVEGKARGGREQLSELLEECLQTLPNHDVDIFRLPVPHGGTPVLERLRGRIDGITDAIESKLAEYLRHSPPAIVIINGSNLGRLARVAKQVHEDVPTLTFYHNIETRFFYDSFRSGPSIHGLGVLLANANAERIATNVSDHRIMLNERDSSLLNKLFRRSGTNVLPMAMHDGYVPSGTNTASPHPVPYALFVGGAFYANVEGIAWYANEVAPHAPIETVVIGRGMHAHRNRLERHGSVRVLGAVDDLSQWYAHAQVVIAPILSGSGMKTKTAEALMHGKPIIGTPEAFVGYETNWSDLLNICETAEEFLQALRVANDRTTGFHYQLRAYYERFHSPAAMREQLSLILEKALQ